MSSIHNFSRLILFTLRRDRLWLALWMGCLFVLATFFAPMIVDVVGDASAQAALEEALSNPAMVALCGPAYGDAYTYGSMYAQFMLVWAALACAVMNILFVVRHTRRNEEEGLSEMLTALPVGRAAPLLTVLVLAGVVNALLAVLISVTIAGFGVPTLDLKGSLLFGCALGTLGLFFAGTTALMAQLFSSARATLGSSLAILGAAYLLRALGDVGSEALALLSPLGLVERSELYVHNALWPELVLLTAGLVLFTLAFALNARRDSGQGLVPTRTGRAHASAFLTGELGLAWRLSRGMMAAWAVAVLVFAAAYGSVFNDLDSFIADNSLYQAMLGVGADKSDILDPVIATMTLLMTIMATIPVLAVVLRLRAEESTGRLEQLLACSVSRVRLIACELALAVALACALQFLTALAMWGAASWVTDSSGEFALYLATAMSFLPAMLVFLGLAILLLGAVPRLSALIWVCLAYAFFVSFLGDVFSLPAWAEYLSIFGLLPRYPAADIEPLRIAALCAAAALCTVAGAVAYRRRDLG
jgi:ABC-2 type transport system permease protein